MPDDLLTAVPPAILRQVTTHLACLREFNAGIARWRTLEQRVGGAGRYESDFRHAREAAAQQSVAWLDRFAALARTNGVDPETVFTALGGRPALEPWSAAALAWQRS